MKSPCLLLLLGTTVFTSVAWVLPARSHPTASSSGSSGHELLGLRSGKVLSPGDAEASSPLAWADLDGDGRLEVLTLHPDGRVALVRDSGGGFLEDCTAELGLAALPPASRALWEDVDGDGALDLLIVAKDGSGRLLVNDPGHGFRDFTESSGLELTSGLSEAGWKDVNGDGRPDLVLLTVEGVRLHRNLGDFHFDRASIELPLSFPLVPMAPATETTPGIDEAAPVSTSTPELKTTRSFESKGAGPRQALTAGVLPKGAVEPPSHVPDPLVTSADLCAGAILDKQTNTCMKASSKPVLGRLYPITTDLFVDAASGHVGINTTSPGARLDVNSAGGLGLAVGSTLSGDTPVTFYSTNTDQRDPTLLVTVADGGLSAFFQETLAVGAAPIAGVPIRSATFGIDLKENAELRMKTSSAVETVTLQAAEVDGNGAQLDLRTAFGQSTITLDAETGSSAGEISMFDVEGNETVQIRSESSVKGSGGQIALRKDDGTNTIIMEAASNSGSELQMLNAAGVETIELLSEEASGNGAQMVLRMANGTSTIVLDAEQGVASQVALFNSSGVETVEIVSEEVSGNGAQIVLRKADGTNGIILDAEQGTDSRITTDTLEITGGADLVESFQSLGDCAPGSVLVIDPDNPGDLALARTPYDRRVAGVVSGAGNVQPGLHLGQRGVLDGDTPVALTGRVYVSCTGENGVIRPGDLLTSSSTPGHAMRATDHERAFGAVIGKAMGALEGESGLVLVLVGLQ